jgi:hypothetical protein
VGTSSSAGKDDREEHRQRITSQSEQFCSGWVRAYTRASARSVTPRVVLVAVGDDVAHAEDAQPASDGGRGLRVVTRDQQ